MSRQATVLCCKAPPCPFWSSVCSQLLVARISCRLRKSTHEEREMAWGRSNATDEAEFPNFLHWFITLQHTYFHYKQKGVIIFILKEPYPVALGKSHSLFLLRDKTLGKDEAYFSKLVKHGSEQWLKVSFILQWVITYNSDREVYYRSLDSSLTTLLKNTCAIIKLPSLHLCSEEKKWTGHLHIMFSQQPQKHKPPSLKWLSWWGFSGLWDMPAPAEEGHQTRATPQLPFAQHIQDLLSHLSATSSTPQDFFLFPSSRRMLRWTVFSEAVLPFLAPPLRKAVDAPSVALMLY